MKKQRKSVMFVIGTLALAGLLAGGFFAFGGQVFPPKQASAGVATPETTPAADRPARDRAVVAKGQVVPVQHASLNMASGGIVAEIMAKEGEQVSAGQVILRLRNERQQAALAEADAALASARAQLEAQQVGPRAEEIAAAQAALDAANARRSRLSEAGRAADIAASRAALEASQAALKRLNDGPDQNTRTAAAADVANAKAAMNTAQAAYDKIQNEPDRGMYPQSLQLEQTTNTYQAAKARYEELIAPPKADAVTQATAQIKKAQADLDRLLVPATPAEIAEADAAARQAQAQLDLLKAGTTKQQIAAAEAAVSQAEAARQGAAASLNETELRSPFTGTLASLYVRVGEQISPGAAAADLGDFSSWQVETDDLSELDVVRVQPGQSVNLTFDAIPGLTLKGTVERIQPKGEKKLGDMTYTAVVRIAEPDPRLLWNMTAVVNLPSKR